VFQVRGQGPGANRQGTQRGPTNNADFSSWRAGPAVIETRFDKGSRETSGLFGLKYNKARKGRGSIIFLYSTNVALLQSRQHGQRLRANAASGAEAL
jgi:hypothetical protein